MKKTILRTVVSVALALLCTVGSCSAQGKRLPILMYHDLTTDPAKTNSMTITADRFRLDMEFLQQFGYTPLLPRDLIAIHEGRQAMPDKPVMVTFDDGYRSNYELAYPVLTETGMKAVVAVVASNIRSDAEALQPRSSMTWGELHEMAGSGVFEIGSHTYDLHNPQYGGAAALDGIDGVMRLRHETRDQYRARVGTDLKTSVQMIREMTGQITVNYFSFPYGGWDAWMPELLAQQGIRVTTLTNPGMANIGAGLENLPRYRIEMHNPLSVLLQQNDKAAPAQVAVTVNGVPTTLPAYAINDNYYVRVRDAAVLLADTSGRFDVQWNARTHQVELTSYQPYQPLGTERAALPAGTRKVRSFTGVTVTDGVPRMVAAYLVDGNTYYKLRSLGELCGFAVDWDGAAHTVVVTA